MAQSNGANKADTAVKLVLMFFISLLSFSVGTYVGKQFSDKEARRVALEGEYGDSEHGDANSSTHGEVTEHGGNAEHGETAKSEEEGHGETEDHGDAVASLSEEYIKRERKVANEHGEVENESHGTPEHKSESHDKKEEDGYTHHKKMGAEALEQAQEQHAIATHGKPQTTTAHGGHESQISEGHGTSKMANSDLKSSTKNHEVSPAASRVAHNLAPSEDIKKVRKPASVLPTVATSAVGKYTVQVASYMTENEAKDHASRLTEKGFSSFYVSAVVNGKNWYRVSVGLFSDQNSASNFRRELLNSKAVATAIVQKIVK